MSVWWSFVVLMSEWRSTMEICFFKQKTAYELRISDWSSDVCSSDLIGLPAVSVRMRANTTSTQENTKQKKAATPMPGAMAGMRCLTKKRGKIGRASCREGVCRYV